MADEVMLIGDLGGTNARFALVQPDLPGYQQERCVSCAEFSSPEAAIHAYLESAAISELSGLCLAVAGPVRNNTIQLTNNHWQVRADSLRACFAVEKVHLLNDFEAIALGLPWLDAACLEPIGPGQTADLAQGDFTLGVIGPGTGLGAAALLKRQGELMPIVTEAGHVGFAPETDLQKAVWERLRQRYDRVSDERLVSGAGVENIYLALSDIHGTGAAPLRAAAIFEQADTNTLAEQTVELFFEVMGQIAGNFALTCGATDGIFIAGGIVQRYPSLLVQSRFRAGFENKGRHRSLMEKIPTLLIRHPNPGLLGASIVARRFDSKGCQQSVSSLMRSVQSDGK